MNPLYLMTTASAVLGLGGLAALFLPDVILGMLGASVIAPLAVGVQLMGILYCAVALIDWTARRSLIGGIYGRAIAMGNLFHFFGGTLTILKYGMSHRMGLAGWLLLAAYGGFTFAFYLLVFRSSGLPSPKPV